MLASPNVEAKSQLVSLKVITWLWLNIIGVRSWLFYAKIFARLGLRVGSSFLLKLIRNTSPKPRLQKVLPCRHPCHSWDLGLGTPCEVWSPNLHALNSWDWMDWPHVTWDVGLGTSCDPGFLSMRWLANPNWGYRHFPHNFWSSWKHLLFYFVFIKSVDLYTH